MKMIPKTFKLFGKDFTVVTRDYMIRDIGAKGRVSDGTQLIELQTTKVSGYNEQDMEQVFLHEIVHAILMGMGEDELSNNEQFVDVMSRLLHQFLLTSDIWQDEEVDIQEVVLDRVIDAP